MRDQFKNGETISHYKIISKIGQGGMGAVYKAEDTKLRRPVALKFLLREKFSSIDKQRFLREAQAAAALHHPNICTIYDVDEVDGEIFFAMAYLEGDTLASRIAAGPMEFEQTIELGIQLADAMQEAHSHGIVHRDIKSNNIVLTPKNQAVILDFGLAQISGASKLTQTGATLGTAAYMSPEHARGLDVDHRGDLWSLAVVLYELATGQLPFRATQDLAMLYCIVNEPHVPARTTRPSLPRQFDDIVNLALAKDPDDRYQHAGELATDLRRLKALTGIEALPTGVIEPLASPPFWKGRRALVGTIAAFVIALGLGVWRWVPSEWLLQEESAPAVAPINPQHLALMPLRYVGAAETEDDAAYCDGLGEWLGDRLASLEASNDTLMVVKPGEIRTAGISGVADARRIFGVGRSVTGTAERDGVGWRVTLNLVDAEAVRQLQSVELRAGRTPSGGFTGELSVKLAALVGVSTADSPVEAPSSGPRDPEVEEAYLRGLGYLRASEGESGIAHATEQFQRALAIDPRHPGALSGLASARLRKAAIKADPNLISAALSESQKAVDADPISPQAHAILGDALAALKRLDPAAGQYRKALAIDPLYAGARHGLVAVLVAQGRVDQAATVLLEYRRRREHDPRARLELADFYAERGRYEDAKSEYTAALEITPRNPAIPLLAASLHRQTDQLDQAKAQVERSLAIRPSSEGYAELGSIEFQAKRYHQAATAYEMATEMKPSSHEYWGALADCYRHLPGSEGQSKAAFGRAIDLARRGLAEKGGRAELRGSLALYLAKSGETAEALKEFAAIGPDARKSAAVLLRSAVVRSLAGQTRQAADDLRAAVRAGASAVDVALEPDLAGLPR